MKHSASGRKSEQKQTQKADSGMLAVIDTNYFRELAFATPLAKRISDRAIAEDIE